MGNTESTYNPNDLGRLVEEADEREKKKSQTIARLEQSLRDLTNSDKIDARQTELRTTRMKNTDVCQTIKGKECEAWCVRKMSQCILLPGAVYAYLTLVKEGVWRSPNPKKPQRKPTSMLTPVERDNTRVYEHTVLTMLYKAWPLMLDIDPPILPDGDVGTDFFIICRASRKKHIVLDKTYNKGDRVMVQQYTGTVVKVHHDNTYDVDLDTLSCPIVNVENRIKEARRRRGNPRTVGEASAYLDDLRGAVKDFERNFFERLSTWQKTEDLDTWIEGNYGTIGAVGSFVLSFAIYYFILYAVIPTSMTVVVSGAIKSATGSTCLSTISMTSLPDIMSRNINTDEVVKSLSRIPFFKKKFSKTLSLTDDVSRMSVSDVIRTFVSMTGGIEVNADKMFISTYNALLGYLKSTATVSVLQYAGVPFINVC